MSNCLVDLTHNKFSIVEEKKEKGQNLKSALYANSEMNYMMK